MTSFEEIADTFDLLTDWEERFSYLIDLGKALPPLPDADRNEANRVHGCQASVWLAVTLDESRPEPRLNLRAISDAHIVNGLIAILTALYDNTPASQARSINPEAAIARLDLADHLSPTRRNGLYAMIERIGALVAHVEERGDASTSDRSSDGEPKAGQAPEALTAAAPLRIFDSSPTARPRVAATPTPDPTTTRSKIIDAIKQVYDPEIPVNLYDLGLIYTIDLAPDERSAKIDMTLTSPACPVAQELPEQVKAAAESVPGIERAEVRVVWEPKWTREMMCDEARLELGLM